MTTQTLERKYGKVVSVPFTLEQIAFSLSQLSHVDLDVLEEAMDRKFQKTILSRGKQISSQYRRGQTISLKKLQKEFGK